MNSHTEREQLKGWLELLVLAMLHHEPTGGYRLRKRIIEKSSHQFAPALGRLYPLLADLEKSGCLKRRKDPEGTRGQQIYSLTPKGEERLSVLKNSWRHFSKALETIATR